MNLFRMTVKVSRATGACGPALQRLAVIVSVDPNNEETKVNFMVTGVGISLASRRESGTELGRINLSYLGRVHPGSPEGVVPLGVGPTGFIIGRVIFDSAV